MLSEPPLRAKRPPGKWASGVSLPRRGWRVQRMGSIAVGHSFYVAYEHIVFGTKNRVAFFDPELEQEAFRYLATAVRSEGCEAMEIGIPQSCPPRSRAGALAK